MANWAIEFSKTAEKQLIKPGRNAQKRIFTFLHQRIDLKNPRNSGKALKGEKGELWRYRIGDYRLICKLHDHTLIILILEIGHRREIYR